MAPGSQKGVKSSNKRVRSAEIHYLTSTDAKLRHTAIRKTSDGRRKHQLSLIPLSADTITNSTPLDKETEMETFQHYLEDDNWITEETITTAITNTKTKNQKKKKVSSPITVSSAVES